MYLRRPPTGSGAAVLAVMAFLAVGCSGNSVTPRSPASTTPTLAPPPTVDLGATPTAASPTVEPHATPTAIHGSGPLDVASLTSLDGFMQYAVGGSPDWQAVSDDAVWVGNDQVAQIDRIDPASNKLTRLDVGFGPCNGLVVGFDALWTADCFGSRLVRIDLDSGKVDGTLRTPIASGGEGLTAAGAGYVWIVGRPGRLLAVNPRTMRVAARVAVPEGSTSVAIGFGAAWVADPDGGTVTRVDPKTMKAVATVDVGGAPRFLTAGQEAIWALNQADGTVARIDPDTNTLVAAANADSPGEGGCIATGASSVWTTTFDRPLTRIDEATGSVRAQFTGGQNGDCVSVGFDAVWLSNLRTGTVWRLPLAGLSSLSGS